MQAATTGRAHHQQRLHPRTRRARDRLPIPRPSTPLPASPSRPLWTDARTTLPAARSISERHHGHDGCDGEGVLQADGTRPSRGCESTMSGVPSSMAGLPLDSNVATLT